jgi:hypothetical protein
MRVVFLCLLAAFWCGCFVFEEIDAGMEMMDKHSPAAKKTPGGKDGAPAQPDKDGEKPVTYAEKVGGWWQNATSLSSQPNASKEPFVQCTAGGKTFFTKKSDCQARGGRSG